jgi:hypothetical protein
MLKEMIAVYSEYNTKHTNTKCRVRLLNKVAHIITTRLQRVKTVAVGILQFKFKKSGVHVHKDYTF